METTLTSQFQSKTIEFRMNNEKLHLPIYQYQIAHFVFKKIIATQSESHFDARFLRSSRAGIL